MSVQSITRNKKVLVQTTFWFC